MIRTEMVELLARNARDAGKALGLEQNLGTWERAVVEYLAVLQAIEETPLVDRGGPSGSGMVGDRHR